MADVLAGVGKREAERLATTVGRILEVATTVSTGAASFRAAIGYVARYGLTAQDAVVYAAVIDHLSRHDGNGPHFFVTRNWRDLGDPELQTELSSWNCTLVPRFSEGAARLRQLDIGGR